MIHNIVNIIVNIIAAMLIAAILRWHIEITKFELLFMNYHRIHKNCN